MPWTSISACAPLAHNLPVRLALLDIWYRNFPGLPSRCIAPYHAWLQRLPAYLQQLEMESNGKRVDSQAAPCPWPPRRDLGRARQQRPACLFQMLHQGGPTCRRWRSSPRATAPTAWPATTRCWLANALARHSTR